MERDDTNDSKENNAGIVMCRTATFPRYKNAERTPMVDAVIAF
jgi:hypothetical protein